MNRFARITAAITSASVLTMSMSACSARCRGSSQQVEVRSKVPGTELFVNEAYVGKDNGVTTFQKKNNYMITARKAGCTDTTVPAPKSFDAITLLGVLIDFGIVSVLLIDGAATGAWQQFDQTSFVVDPRCS